MLVKSIKEYLHHKSFCKDNIFNLHLHHTHIIFYASFTGIITIRLQTTWSDHVRWPHGLVGTVVSFSLWLLTGVCECLESMFAAGILKSETLYPVSFLSGFVLLVFYYFLICLHIWTFLQMFNFVCLFLYIFYLCYVFNIWKYVVIVDSVGC